MGNASNTTLKEDICVEITKEQIQDYQEKIHVVDQTMSGFAKSLDSLKASCELLLRESDKRVTAPQDKDKVSCQSNMDEEAELAVQVLKTIHESLSDQKITAFESLIKLLHFIAETGSRYTHDAGNAMELSLEKYMKTIHTESDAKNTQLPYYETRIQDLRKELSLQIELNKINECKIRVLNERLGFFEEEKDTLNGRIKTKDDEIERLNDEIVRIKRETEHPENGFVHVSSVEINNIQEKSHTTDESMESNLTFVSSHFQDVSGEFQNKGAAHQSKDQMGTQDSKVSELTHEIRTLNSRLDSLYKKTCIHVQILNRNAAKKSVADVIEKLKSEINIPTCELYIIKRKESAEVDPELPLLVFSHSKLGPSNAAKDALQGLEAKKTMALLLVHRDISESGIRSSAATILSGKYKSLGGIFDILHDHQKGIVQGDLNSRSLNELTKFINKYGAKKSRVETFHIE